MVGGDGDHTGDTHIRGGLGKELSTCSGNTDHIFSFNKQSFDYQVVRL